jgi:hypothetical protein
MAPHLGLEFAVMIEQTITIGNIIEIVVIGAGGISVFVTMRNTVASIKREVDAMQTELKKLGEILIAQADMRGEMRVLDTRVLAIEGDIRDMQHGRGFITGPK